MTYPAVLAALADPTRRSILELLRDGPVPVGELAERLPVSRAAVSQHLKILKNANLVSETAAGTRRLYRADPEGLAELQRYLENFWGEALSAYVDAAVNDSPSRGKKGKRNERKKR
jgi:DNA-binding transcriptional ArsR family regulator